jgi:hypothetical protein
MEEIKSRVDILRAPIESNRIEFLEIRFDVIESNLYKSSIRSNIR